MGEMASVIGERGYSSEGKGRGVADAGWGGQPDQRVTASAEKYDRVGRMLPRAIRQSAPEPSRTMWFVRYGPVMSSLSHRAMSDPSRGSGTTRRIAWQRAAGQ